MRTLPLLGERYRLGPVVGTGGMGTVHRAWDERFGREVAVKVVRAGADTVEQERLRREAQYLARLDHPNLIAVYDAGADRGGHGETVWFAMELVEGPDLRRVIAEEGRLPTGAVARVLAGAAGALQTLHEAGVVHRDLKPANVLLTRPLAEGRWEAKLADLGIARLIRADALTMTGQVVGTAAYLSPEQVCGEEVGPASDVYSLGLLALEALTGKVVFPGPVAEAAAARLMRSPEIPRSLDREWRALLGAMTARRPADRPSTAEVVRRSAGLSADESPLEDATGSTAVLPAEDLPTQAMDATAPMRSTGWSPALRGRPPRRRRVLLGAAAVAVAAGLAGGGASIAGLASAGPAGVAAPRTTHAVHSTPHPSATPSHHAKPSASVSAAVAEKTVTKQAVTAPQPSQQVREQRSRWRQRAEQQARRFEQRLRDRLLGHR